MQLSLDVHENVPVSHDLLSCLSLFDRSVTINCFQEEKAQVRPVSREARAQAQSVLEWCLNHGATVLHPGHPDYPDEFLRLEKPPLFLSYFGSPAWRGSECLSVVGSREPSSGAVDWVDVHLTEFLRRTGLVTVSGGARGCDQRAHLASLRLGKPTIAFLPAGLGQVYPKEFSSWVPEIIRAGGAVISEFAPLEPMQKGHFERRNRLIASLGKMLFVVEARRRSGSLITARLAEGASKTICVLPSAPGDGRSAGTVDLLFDGAQPLRDAADLISLYYLCSPCSPPRAAQTPDCGD